MPLQQHASPAKSPRPRANADSQSVYGGLATVAAGVVFAVDLTTELGPAVGVAYVFAVFLADKTRRSGWVWSTAALCTALTIAGYEIGSGHGHAFTEVANRGMTIALVLVSAVWSHRTREAADSAKNQATRLQAILEAAPVGMLVVDHSGAIRFMNSCLLRMFGYAKEELIGRPIETLIPERFRERHPELLRVFVGAPKARQMGKGVVLAGARKDGSEFPVEIGLSPVASADGPAVVASVLDTSRRNAGQAAQAKLAAIVDGSEDAIIARTLDGVVTSWNRGAEALYGYLATEMVGHSTDRIVPPAGRDELQRTLARVAQGEPTTRVETLRITKSGEPRNVAVTISPIRDPLGAVVGSSAIAHDITGRLRQEIQLAQYTAALERANRDLDDFVYAAAHDLRSPLDGLRNLARWIADDNAATLAPQSQKHLDQMHRRVARLQQLLSDLLQYARAGQPSDKIADVAVAGVITDIREHLQLAPTFELVVEGPLPTLRGSRQCIHQAFYSLLENAIKHHDADRGRVVVKHREFGSFHEFSVSDDGPGISPEFQSQVFRLFETLRPRDEVEGSGMGLAITKKIVDRHGGAITIASSGRGTCVAFTWPKQIEFAATGS